VPASRLKRRYIWRRRLRDGVAIAQQELSSEKLHSIDSLPIGWASQRAVVEIN